MVLFDTHGFWFCLGIALVVIFYPKEVAAFCLLAIAAHMGALTL